MVYTFYSYKGGVGRSMALANIAELFYQDGQRVLMIDWDLEAPGIERYFFDNSEDVLGNPGVIDMLIDYKTKMEKDTDENIQLESENLEKYLFKNLEKYLINVYPNSSHGGQIFLLTAGRRSSPNFTDYAKAVIAFDWQDFYENWEGEIYFELLREQLENIADIILIDSRTGVTEMGGVCTYQLADTVVMFCAPNQQNMDGIYDMALNFTSPDLQNLRPERPLNVLIVPARVEDRAEVEQYNNFRHQFSKKFDKFLLKTPLTKFESFWKLKIPYLPYLSYDETIAVQKQISLHEDIVESYKYIADVMNRLAGYEDEAGSVKSTELYREDIQRNGQLKKRIIEQESYIEILEELSKRIVDIPTIYMPVARYIKRISQEGIDDEEEIFLGIVKNFLSGELSTNAFISFWQQMVNAQPWEKGINYEMIGERLKRGEVIPFIGSEIHQISAIPLPSNKEIAKKLSEYANYQDFIGSLPTISQYYEMAGYGRRTLINRVKDLTQQEAVYLQSNPFYDLLGDITVPLIVISSSYDTLLESVFQKKGKKFVIISHQREYDSIGKILVKYSGMPEPEEYSAAESIFSLSLLENGYSIIYKICGCFGLYTKGIVDQMDPLTISEDDFFSLAKNLDKIIPDYLLKHFSRRIFLFLGYNTEEWQDRLLVNFILEKKRVSMERSYTVLDKPTPYESAYWKFNGIDILQVRLKQFVDQLLINISDYNNAADNATPIEQNRFDVFLCYNSQDKAFVKKIGEKLKQEAALRPWLDEWELRPGLPWQAALEKQIENIKSVAVFVGENSIGPWQNMEQAAFIRQFVNRQCPVIPVILPDCLEVPELPLFLEGMTWVDFRKTDPDPIDQLIWGITGIRTTTA